MRWIVHGTLTPAVADALRRRGDVVQKPTELGIEDGAPTQVWLEAAHKAQVDVMTNDAQLIAAPYEAGVSFGRSIVFLQLDGEDVEQDDAVDRLFARYPRLTPGRLYTVTGTRVKIRQLPGQR